MHSVIISIGSNTSDRREQVEKAILWLRQNISSAKVSSVYDTPPEGTSSCHDYTNAIFYGETTLSAEQLESMLKKYERDNGRTPQARAAGLVPVDLDLVFYDRQILRPKELTRRYFLTGFHELGFHEDLPLT